MDRAFQCKNKSSFNRLVVLFFFFLLSSFSWGQTSERLTTSGTFYVPYGVTEITVECWGAGGAGGARTSKGTGGGGGGGAYASRNLNTVVGSMFSYTIGQGGKSSTTNNGQVNGGTTSFFTNIKAAGGISVNRNVTTGAAGGSKTNSDGAIPRDGGKGSNSTNSTTGGGGGVAGPNNDGKDAAGGTGGVGYGPIGFLGYGANGHNTNNAVGNNGNNYGGGGSGAKRNNNGNTLGGAGADGCILVTYTSPYKSWFYTSGDAGDVSSWKNNTGDSPVNFTDPNQAFIIIEGGNAVLSSPLSIAGDNSVLYIADKSSISLEEHDLTIGVKSRIESAGSGIVITSGSGAIVKKGIANADFAMVFPIGTLNGSTPFCINSLSATTIGADAYVKVRSVDSKPSGIAAAGISRYWETQTSGFDGSILADVSFTYGTNDLNGVESSLLDLQYSTDAGATWQYPGGVSRTGIVPLSASTATTLDAIWTAAVSEKKVWYSLTSGNWDAPSTWTLDPSGAQPNNPNGLTPRTSSTANADEVVVLSGRSVVITENNTSNARLTVHGTLDFGTTTGSFFSNIDGDGRILLAGDNFPKGNAFNFITKGQGEGTVEYYGTTRDLKEAHTFYNVIVNIEENNELTLLADYKINGDFTVTKGSFKINSNSATTPLNINVDGNLLVEPKGKIATGSANARHQLNLYGNFTNNGGEVRFTNRTVADYINEATDGVVDVNFLNTLADQKVLCRGITNFYRIEIDKGVDKTYILSIDASSPDNFKLLGYANENHALVPQLAENSNALGLVRGTVRLGNSLVIPTLSMADSYVISENAEIIVDGASLTKNEGKTLYVYGTLKAQVGTINVNNPNGIVLCGNGSLNVDGGVLTTNQLKVAEGADHNGSYIQAGGTVNVTGIGANPDFFVFTLSSPSSVFNMSGGTLNVNAATGMGGIFINSTSENIHVTGGTVVAETKVDGDFTINSTAPFWNLLLKNSAGADRRFKLDAATNIGDANLTVPAQPLRVLKDLRLWGKESGGASYPVVELIPGATDVYIGGSFYVEKGAKYTPVSGGTYPYDTEATQPLTRNTTFFNKTNATPGVGVIYNGDTENPLEFGSIVVDRTSGYEVLVATPTGRLDESVILDVNGTATVSSGVLDQGRYSIRTWGAIVNYGRMGKYVAGTTPDRAQIRIMENSNLTIATDKNAVFGNVRVDVAPPTKLELTGDTYIERLEYVRGLIYLKNYILKLDYLWGINSGLFENISTASKLAVKNTGYSGESMMFTNGDAGDGGLKLRVNGNSIAENESSRKNNQGPITYPLGFTTDGGTSLYFRPAQMVVKNFSDDGYVTIRPVSGYLQTTNNTGKILQHYWRVTHEGFAAKPTVAYRFYYRNSNTATNNNKVDLYNTTTGEENLFVPGKVLDENPYTRSYESTDDINRTSDTRTIVINGTSTNSLFTTAANGIQLENANYTAGASSRFTGSVLIYYTIDQAQEPRWTTGTAWARSDKLNPAYSPHDSRQNKANSYPGPGDVAVIGWIPWEDAGRAANLRGMPHGMWIDSETREVAEVVFTQMTDVNGNPVARSYRSNFQFRPTLCINQPNGQLVAKLVKGEGLFWNRQSDPDYTKMDIGDFARQDSSYVIYENFSDGRTIYKSADLFPNLYISNDGWGNSDRNFTFQRSLETTGNVELLGDVNLILSTGATGDITVGRNLVMFTSQNSGGGAELRFGSTGTARKIVVKGDLLMRNANSLISVVNGGSLEHELHVEGDIVQGASGYASDGLQLFNSANRSKVTLFIEGSKSMAFTSPNANKNSSLYRVIVNKGTSAATTATFNTNFTLNGSTSGVGVAKALELQNGTFIYNPTDGNNSINLSTGDDFFSIPATAGLTIKNGIMKVSGKSGIALDGKLTLEGGTLDMDDDENHIEYSASGNSSISISGSANLSVGGQIRRNTTSDAGILKYSQTGGNVVVGAVGASVNNRGVFEILNSGSSFTMTNGSLTIAKAQTNPSISAFYFDPESYNISNSTIIIGNSSTGTSEKIGIYANKPLPKLQVFKGVAKLEVVPATITQLLEIKSGATFDADGLGLTLKGDFTAIGTYIPNGNTTYFSGTSAQTITGNGGTLNFYNFDKTTSSTLTFSGATAPTLVANDMLVRGGTLAASSCNITVKGNLLNDGIFTCTSGIDYGVYLNGSTRQQLSGNGTFGKLSILNLNGVDVPVGSNIKVSSSLKMMGGILNVGQNYFDLGSAAVIEAATPFSKTNMITTNISFNDNGVRKTFKAGATSNFIFPVGSGDKYTPVTFDVTANENSTGSIAVVPANEMHTSIIEDTETGAQIVDKDNALQYYWTLKSEGIKGFTGTAKMHFIDTDVKVTTPYSEADYITAQLLRDGSGKWLKFDKSDVDITNHNLLFNFSGKDDATISGDYTAGAVDDSKNGAIPDEVAKYETNSTGTWNTTSVWTPNVAGGPHGAITKINLGHTVTMTENFYSEYSTEIQGMLKVNTTLGHRLGIVSGTGTIYTEVGALPAAVYDSFFAVGGGTLEFSGSSDYEILGNILTVNNLTLTGSGTKTLPNNNVTLNGNLMLNGDFSLKNSYNKMLSVNGNITHTQGSFDAGTGSTSTVAMVGSGMQTISGAFANENAFNNLQINKPLGKVTIDNNVEIDRQLLLTKGVFDVEEGRTFKVNYGASVVGGNLSSFVTGELTKDLMNGESFTYPIGDVSTQVSYGEIALKNVSGPSGICEWKARYFFRVPECDVTAYEYPIASISNSEYWKFTAPTGGQAYISIALNGTNDVANGLTDISNLRVVGFNLATNKWEVVGTGATVVGTKMAGTITTSTRVNFGSYSCFTLGAVTPLDAGSAWFVSNATVNLCEGSTTLKVGFSGSSPWEFSYTKTVNGGTPVVVNVPSTSSNPYTFEETNGVGTIVYKLISMKSGNVPGIITTGRDQVVVTVSGKPTVTISAGTASPICEGSSITFTATAGLKNYRFRVDNIDVQNGSSNTFTTSSLAVGTRSVDVVASNAGGCLGTSSALSIVVNPKPSAAGTISGEASVCLNTTATYSISTVANAESYVWTVENAVIVSGQGTSSISIKFSNSGNAKLNVLARNGCGDGAPATKIVAVSTSATAGNAGTIAGVSDICKGGTYSFSVGDVENATSYVWSYSGTGATINGSGKEVTVDFSAGATSGNLTVYGTNGCNNGGISPVKTIVANTPPSVSFTNSTPSGCEGSSIQLAGSATGGTQPYAYTWSGTSVGSLSSSNISNPTFTVDNESGDFDLTIRATDGKGCYNEKTTTITVYERPRANAGADALDICSGMNPITMTGATASGSFSGTPSWTVNPSSAGSITNSTDPAYASFTPINIFGEATLTLKLTGSNGCADATDSRLIKWSGVPLQPSAITGSASVCKSTTSVPYSVLDDNFVEVYTWSYSGTGATINQNRNSITIDFAGDATSGKLSVYGKSSCGESSVRELNITLNDIPTTPAIGSISACAGSVSELKVVSPIAGYTYSWSVASDGYTISNPNTLNAPNNDTLFPETSPEIVHYPAVKLEVTNANGCKNEVINNDTNKYIKILRIPRTGTPYHLRNNVAE